MEAIKYMNDVRSDHDHDHKILSYEMKQKKFNKLNLQQSPCCIPFPYLCAPYLSMQSVLNVPYISMLSFILISFRFYKSVRHFV